MLYDKYFRTVMACHLQVHMSAIKG